MSVCKKYPAKLVGKWFKNKSLLEGVPITLTKIELLIYAAKGFSMAQGRDIVKEKVLVGCYGPEFDICYLLPTYLDIYRLSILNKDYYAMGVLEKAWRILGFQSTARILGAAMHETSPWAKARHSGFDVIPDVYMLDFFGSLIVGS